MDAETREYIRAVRDAVVGERYRHEASLKRLGYSEKQLPTLRNFYGKREGGAMALSGSAKELKPLIDEIRKNGFKVAPSGKHRKVVDVEGKIMGARNKVVT